MAAGGPEGGQLADSASSVVTRGVQVCEGWRGLAVRLGLATFVPDILCCKEKCKLRILLDVWKEESSSTFTVDTLKTILCQEVRPVARRPA